MLSGCARQGLIAAALLMGTACKDEASDSPPREAIPAPPSPPGSTAKPSASDPAAGERRGRLLAWLDPEAVSVAYLGMPVRLRGDAVAVVYGLPPRAEELLRAVTDIDAALEAVRPPDAPTADTWLSAETLVTTARMSRRPLVMRALLVPREQAIERLEALGLERKEVDAFEIWEPRRVFPYRVVLLAGDVAGFIPTSEPGTGLPPLIAARDLPASEVETQLAELLATPDAPAVALFAAGPMLHLDLDQDVLSVRFEVRRSPDGGLDGQVVLHIDGDPSAAAATLEGRKAPEQSDGIQQLVERAAYLADGPVVAGRLQLSRADAAQLEVEH